MNSERFHLERLDTATGALLIVSDEQQRVRAVDWEDSSERMQRLLNARYGRCGYRLLQHRCAATLNVLAISAYFAGDLAALDTLRTETRGTDFQRRVWSALRGIPAGTTLSYAALAAAIGAPAAVRAVGAANAANPIPIVVPCHRVIGTDTSLTGFGGGLERKRWLLDHERRHAPAVKLQPQGAAALTPGRAPSSCVA